MSIRSSVRDASWTEDAVRRFHSAYMEHNTQWELVSRDVGDNQTAASCAALHRRHVALLTSGLSEERFVARVTSGLGIQYTGPPPKEIDTSPVKTTRRKASPVDVGTPLKKRRKTISIDNPTVSSSKKKGTHTKSNGKKASYSAATSKSMTTKGNASSKVSKVTTGSNSRVSQRKHEADIARAVQHLDQHTEEEKMVILALTSGINSSPSNTVQFNDDATSVNSRTNTPAKTILLPSTENFKLSSKSARHSMVNEYSDEVSKRPTDSQAPTDPMLSALCKKTGNFLNNPKAFRWALCEYFYCSLDMAIFRESRNDFERCLDFVGAPSDRAMSRAEWSIARSAMGRPRRLSVAFLSSEREKLARLRAKIRLAQHGVFLNPDPWPDVELPIEIPLPLVVGQRVVACPESASSSQKSGSVLAVDAANQLFHVKFDEDSLGVQCLPDTYVQAEGGGEMVAVIALLQARTGLSRAVRSGIGVSPFGSTMRTLHHVTISQAAVPPPSLLTQQEFQRSPASVNTTSNNVINHTKPASVVTEWALDDLELLARIIKLQSSKREMLVLQRSMNDRAEYLQAIEASYTQDFMKNLPRIDDTFERRYRWVLNAISQTNAALNQAIIMLRDNISGDSSSSGSLPRRTVVSSLRRETDASARVVLTQESTKLSLGKDVKGEVNGSNSGSLVTAPSALDILSCSATSLFEAIEMSENTDEENPVKSKEDREERRIRSLIADCVSLLNQIHAVAISNSLSTLEVSDLLDGTLKRLSPSYYATSGANLALRDISSTVDYAKTIVSSVGKLSAFDAP